MIEGILSSEIDSVWATVEPQIQRVTDRFDIGETPNDIYRRVKQRDQQLWLCNKGEGVCISEIKILPRFNILAFPVIAGDNMAGWLDDLVDMAKAYGKHHNCKYVEGYGRKGWLRALREHGFKEYAITTRLKL